MSTSEILRKSRNDGESLDLGEIEALLSLDDSSLPELWGVADEVRSREVGDDIWLRGLVEMSNYCASNCNYCGLRRDNSKLTRYRLDPEEILAAVDAIAGSGIGTVVLQSGEDPYWNTIRMRGIIEEIKARHDIAVTLSLGFRDRRDLEVLRAAGADRYLLRHEIANAETYTHHHPDSSLRDRVAMLRILGELGFEVGTGNLVGLPGGSVRDLARDVDLARSLGVDMYGVGPFIPHPDTPLRGARGGNALMTYKMIAVLRIVLRDVHLPVTTALMTLDARARERAWSRGANVFMPNATPLAYRSLYELYRNRRSLGDALEEIKECIECEVESMGRRLGRGHGGTMKGRMLP